MNMFGFMIGITLVGTLFLFDLHVTKYTQRHSSWGVVLSSVLETFLVWKCVGIGTIILLWICGIAFGNVVTDFQILLSITYSSWMILTFIMSTIFYYTDYVKDQIDKEN